MKEVKKPEVPATRVLSVQVSVCISILRELYYELRDLDAFIQLHRSAIVDGRELPRRASTAKQVARRSCDRELGECNDRNQGSGREELHDARE